MGIPSMHKMKRLKFLRIVYKQKYWTGKYVMDWLEKCQCVYFPSNIHLVISFYSIRSDLVFSLSYSLRKQNVCLFFLPSIAWWIMDIHLEIRLTNKKLNKSIFQHVCNEMDQSHTVRDRLWLLLSTIISQCTSFVCNTSILLLGIYEIFLHAFVI